MNKWTKTAGLLFMAAASVYSDRAIAAKPAKPANSADKTSATDVKVLDDTTDPFAAAPTTNPTTNPIAAADSKGPAAAMQMNPDGTFSLNITAGADVVEQLRVIGFQAQESIIPSREVHGSLPAMDLYNVTVHEALDAVLHANGYDWREKGKFIYVYSAKEIADQEKAARVTDTRVFRLYYTPAADALVMIKPVLSKDGGEASVTPPAKTGIATGSTDAGGDSHSAEDCIVVTDYPENLDKVASILKEIDRRPQQILVEATILSARLSENNALGIDFNVVGGVDFTSLTHASGQATNANIGTSPSAITPSQTTSTIGTGNSFSSPITNSFKVGVVTDNLSVFLSALEGVTDTTVLANPKVLALNKQKGEVVVGKQIGYLSTTTTETTSTQTVQFLETGTRLVFRPYIADDGYIRMEVHPEDSDGGLQTAQNLPFKSTTEVTTNVMVKDGRTVVIGGLFRESSSSTRSQVPGLGDIPLAGMLFRNQTDVTERDELIILLTPHIVKDDDAYSQLSAQQEKEFEKLRVGVRKGMMFWGRERLAEMYYESAVNEMSKRNPDRKSALWNLDAAINLNPKYLEAIDLKEELTGKTITSSDNSSIRSFVSQAIMKDTAPAKAEAPVAPATQSVADADQAIEDTASQSGFDDASAPTSQPAGAAFAEAPSSQPSQTTAQADDAGNQLADAPTSAPASTQPMAATDSTVDVQAKPSTVTELPVDELPSQSMPESDMSK